MLHQCNIWCTKVIGRKSSHCKASDAFFLSLRCEKNNLGQSVTFLVATDIGYLLSINMTYFKYNV